MPNPNDIWYALANTEVVLQPLKRLETFGHTVLNYHVVTEKMDSVNEVRVREGRIHAERPQVLTPHYFEKLMLEGFDEEAEGFASWLKEHVRDLTFLKYGFRFNKEELRESTIHESFEVVVGNVVSEVQKAGDPLAAVIKGVDDPWEICLLKFMTDTIRQAVPEHMKDLHRHKLLEEVDGIPRAVQEEIEADFLQAGSDRAKMMQIAEKLKRYEIFEAFEDRFYELVRRLSK